MIKAILRNEIKKLIGHLPDNAELKSALDYLSDNLSSNFTFSDVNCELYNWRHDCMQQCEECGDYFLKLEESDHTMRVMGRLFCSRRCCDNWEYWHAKTEPEISQHI